MPSVALQERPFGNTGLVVSALGLGAAEIGAAGVSEDEAQALLHEALDLGINFIDTARLYGDSEERIGRALASRRGDFVLSSKCGYDIPGIADWTGAAVAAGVNAALKRLRTGWIDVMHLHSCPREVLERGDVIEALEDAVRAGKVRVAAYSGENEHLAYAISTGRFGAIQTSVNICDQRALITHIPEAERRGMGVIGKRPLANAPWRYAQRPTGEYVEVYWDRFRAMNPDPGGLDWDEVAIRFAAFAPCVHTVIAGTASREHLRRNAAHVARGPLPNDIVVALMDAFRRHDDNWTGQV
jgi:aryl-alcohol dehydrogenase-like predicted oxidoreductase